MRLLKICLGSEKKPLRHVLREGGWLSLNRHLVPD